eukprot:gene9274-1548_t
MTNATNTNYSHQLPATNHFLQLLQQHPQSEDATTTTAAGAGTTSTTSTTAFNNRRQSTNTAAVDIPRMIPTEYGTPSGIKCAVKPEPMLHCVNDSMAN